MEDIQIKLKEMIATILASSKSHEMKKDELIINENNIILKKYTLRTAGVDTGVRVNDLKETYLKYRETYSEELCSKVWAHQFAVVTNIETITYNYTLEDLIKIEQDIISNGTEITIDQLKKNKYEIKGYYLYGSNGKIFFNIYNKLKEQDHTFKRPLYKNRGDWMLVTSKNKVEINDEDIKKVEHKKQVKEDKKNRIIWISGNRYKVEDGIEVEDAEFVGEFATYNLGPDGYWSDGLRLQCGYEISSFDEECGKYTLYATKIS